MKRAVDHAGAIGERRSHQRRVSAAYCNLRKGDLAALGCDVDAHGTFHRVSAEGMWSARLWTGAGQALSSKRLHTNDRADDGSIDVYVAGWNQRADTIDKPQ